MFIIGLVTGIALSAVLIIVLHVSASKRPSPYRDMYERDSAVRRYPRR